jgi:FkbH-like protein
LPRPPADFRQLCKAAAGAYQDAGKNVARLASFALDQSQLVHLAKTIAELRAAGSSLAPLTPFKLGVLGNGTLDVLLPAFIASAARHGVALECVKADFGQTVQEALDSNSAINRAAPNAVLLSIDHRGLPLRAASHDSDAAIAAVKDSVDLIATLRNGFRANAGALSIVQTLAPVPESLFGNLDAGVPSTMRSLTSSFNAAIIDDLRSSEDIVFDVASLAETVGLAAWHSPKQWNIGKLAFDSAMIPLYADHVSRIIGAICGKSRKCLVLDLDNTIWGGVIGDDGLDGIVLGQGSGAGEAFLDVQRMALALRERGIVLAVSSKNEDATARAVFTNHPEMLLSESHIAVFQANWRDKATNIAAIASELTLGIDAMVFLDDNPVERALVREMLPQVGVPELPDDPALYARTLSAAGYFETVAFSEEDRKRAEYYADNARRVNLAREFVNLEAYLSSLNMKITFRPFDSIGRSRIAQLINKSNQFNLTTRRYSEVDVASFENDPTIFTLQVRLEDKFGDNGMISVIVCKPLDGDRWEIDTWLMSCRVLGRGVERMVLREILAHARDRGIRRVVGVYRPTEKNVMVSDHYANLGFSPLSAASSEHTLWEIDSNAEIEAAPMAVDRETSNLANVAP